MTSAASAVPVRVGLLTSIGRTLDGFFPPIVDRLRSRGFVVAPASGTHSDLAGWTPLPGVGQRPSPSSVRASQSVRRWVAAEALDVVVTNTATASAIVRGAGVPAPVVYFCHGLHWQDSQSLSSLPWQVIERSLLPRTAAVITLNRDDEQWFGRHTRKKVHRLTSGVGVPLADYPAVPVPAGDLELLWAGDFTPRKRAGLAVTVVKALRLRGVPVRLTMLGDGPLHEQVQREISELGLAEVVRTPGRGRVAPALAAATALLHTATWEGLPRVALEAAAVGRWTYGFDVKGLRDAPLVRVAPDGAVADLAALLAQDLARGALYEVPDVRAQLDVVTAADRLGAIILETLGRTGPSGSAASPTEG